MSSDQGEAMQDGINLDPSVLIAVQNERLASAAIREAQLTAAVQQLTMENMRLEALVPKDEEVTEDASADAS